MAGFQIEGDGWEAVAGDPGDEEYTEIAGDGDDDDVMEARRLLAMAGDPGAVGDRPKRFRHHRPDRGQYVDLPFPLTTLPAVALGTSDAVARPQEAFRPERLTIDPSAGVAVGLIIIGRSVQFVATTGFVPASVFAFNALGAKRYFKTAQIAQDVVIRLVNLTGAPGVTVAVTFSGPAVY